jgi:VIT1/CCC1 family predicted Fe2+/Mn2+ transporter
MARKPPKRHQHRSHRSGWLRAAVLGANDGILSTGSLLLGVASSDASRASILIAGVAGLVAGAMAMAAGEYVSVSSQADTEKADLAMEQVGLDTDLEYEHAELAEIYVQRGLTTGLAQEVARQLMAFDALGAHARDDIGLSDIHAARPIQAALASGASFTVGAALPLTCAILVSGPMLMPVIAAFSLFVLGTLGALAAQAGGASPWRGAARVLFWGAMAMGFTTAAGHLVGAPL